MSFSSRCDNLRLMKQYLTHTKYQYFLRNINLVYFEITKGRVKSNIGVGLAMRLWQACEGARHTIQMLTLIIRCDVSGIY